MEAQLRQLINHTLTVLQNPQASPRETVVLAAIVVVILFAVLAFLSLFFVGKPKRDLDAPPVAPVRKLSVKTDIIVLGGALLITIAVVMGVFAAVSRTPSYCRSCHEMARDYKSWTASTHSRVECANCHQEPGLFGYTLFKLRLVNMALARASGAYAKPIRASVTNSSCVQCHESDIRGSLVVSGIRMRHSDVVAAGYKCVRCHSTAGHGSQTVLPTRPTMDECSACHDGQKAFADCDRCHVVDIGRSVGVPEEYPGAKLGPVTTCRGCHSVAKCNKCHGLELPHPPEWMSKLTHAPAAAFERKQVCARCHSEVFCNQCHTGFPAHGAGWKQQHAAVGPYKQAGCLGCHKRTNNLCAECHNQYSGIKVEQPRGREPLPEVPPGAKSF